MGITESLTYHRDQLELHDDYSASWLADATKYPKYRSVEYWHSVWRTTNLGPRMGDGVASVSITFLLLSLLLTYRLYIYRVAQKASCWFIRAITLSIAKRLS